MKSIQYEESQNRTAKLASSLLIPKLDCHRPVISSSQVSSMEMEVIAPSFNIKDINEPIKRMILNTNRNSIIDQLEKEHNCSFREKTQDLYGANRTIIFTPKELQAIVEHRLIMVAYIDLLTHSDNAYHLTYVPPKRTKYVLVKRRLCQFLRYLEQRIYRNKAKPNSNGNRSRWLDCVLIRERHKSGTVHFHIIIRDTWGDLEKYGEFKWMVDLASEALSNTLRNESKHRNLDHLIHLKTARGRTMSAWVESMPDIDVKKYEYKKMDSEMLCKEVGALEFYLTKEISKKPYDKAFINNIFFSSKLGIIDCDEDESKDEGELMNVSSASLRGFWHQ